MDAAGALDSFLGRLTTVLVEEAQLLGRVRSDIEFIKEEMECMNSLILQLTEAQFRDHIVRAWMKQVVGLTRDCEGNVELYIHYVSSMAGDDGLLGYLHRILRFLRTIPVRHHIATRIKELKVRARDVGGRRQRYGVIVPASAMAGMRDVNIELVRKEVLQDLRRCAAVLLVADESARNYEDVETRVMDSLIKGLTQDGTRPPRVKVFSVLCNDQYFANYIAKKAHQHPSLPTLFSFKVWHDKILGRVVGRDELTEVLEQILLAGVQDVRGQTHKLTNELGLVDKYFYEEELIKKIQKKLKDQRFFIVFTAVDHDDRILDVLFF